MNKSKAIKIIQRFIKNKVLLKNNEYFKLNILSSKYQTKNWRKEQPWYKNGKHNECEKYQLKNLEFLINNKIEKTNDRIYYPTNQIINSKNIFKNIDAFEYSENFDGMIIKHIKNKKIIYYYNCKFVCNSGGAQVRALRETYLFIKYQFNFLNNSNDTNNTIYYFINILDGNCCYNNLNKIIHLYNLYDIDLHKYIYIGDLFNYSKSFNKYNIIE